MHSKPTQAGQILEHLQKHRSITPLDALNLYGCFRLAARIHELRRHGIDIKDAPWKTPGGARVSRYFLPNA